MEISPCLNEIQDRKRPLISTKINVASWGRSRGWRGSETPLLSWHAMIQTSFSLLVLLYIFIKY